MNAPRSWYAPGSRRPRVGALPYVPTTADATAAADAYTYGAASSAYAQGQAMAAWAELQKQQNSPQVQQVSTASGCSPGFLFAPDGSGFFVCRSPFGIDIRPYSLASANSGSPGAWHHVSALVNWMRLHAPHAIGSGSWDGGSLKKYNDAALAGLRALGMTTGLGGGWQNVRSQLRAVAWAITQKPNGSDVDEIQGRMAEELGPYYDADVAAFKAAGGDENPGLVSTFDPSLIADPSPWRGLLVLGAVAAAGFAVVYPAAALATVRAVPRYAAPVAKGAVKVARGAASTLGRTYNKLTGRS